MLFHPTRILAGGVVALLFLACNDEFRDDGVAEADALTASRPAGCIAIVAGDFAIGGGPSITHGQQPTSTAAITTSIGEALRRDEVRLRIDAAARPGTYRLEGAASCYEKGTACVVVAEDLDPATLIPAKWFAAVGGTVEVEAETTPEERAGRVRHVALREITIASTNVPWRAATLVPGGSCLWIEEAKFDMRRPDGCDPNASASCGAGRVCIARDAAGTDGACVAAGATLHTSEPCAPDPDGGSACGPGDRCIDTGSGPHCTPTCDLLAPRSGCPDAPTCGAFGVCRAPAALDPAQIGEPCAEGATCGRDGARGTCFTLYDPAGNPWTQGPKCWGYARARSACPAGEDLGYVAYAQGKDRSLGVCTPRL